MAKKVTLHGLPRPRTPAPTRWGAHLPWALPLLGELALRAAVRPVARERVALLCERRRQTLDDPRACQIRTSASQQTVRTRLQSQWVAASFGKWSRTDGLRARLHARWDTAAVSIAAAIALLLLVEGARRCLLGARRARSPDQGHLERACLLVVVRCLEVRRALRSREPYARVSPECEEL